MLKAGDYIYGVRVGSKPTDLIVAKNVIKSVGKKTLRVQWAVGGFGLSYRTMFKLDEVFTTPQAAIFAYKQKVESVIASMKRQITEENAVLIELDRLASHYVETN